MTDVNSAPLVAPLFEKEAKAAIAFSVDLAFIKFKTLRNCGFHFCYCAIALNIRRASVNTMHNEGAAIHARLGRKDKVLYRGSSRPSRIDKCSFMKDGLEILPFASVATRYPLPARNFGTDSMANPPPILSIYTVLVPNYPAHCYE